MREHFPQTKMLEKNVEPIFVYILKKTGVFILVRVHVYKGCALQYTPTITHLHTYISTLIHTDRHKYVNTQNVSAKN